MSTRNEVDRVWAAMLDATAPPLPTADEALQVARTSRRRHTALVVVGRARPERWSSRRSRSA